MSLRRIFILYLKEVVQGPKNYIFIFALVVPIVLTLLVSLVFGTYFSGKSRLGIVDQGSSRLVALMEENRGLLLRTFTTPAEMEDALERGALDMGLVLPANFDAQLAANQPVTIRAYIWGESLLQHRAILGAAVINAIRQIIGQDVPVDIHQVVLGTGVNIPWEKRLLPLIVMMAVLLSGSMIPATSLVGEKTKRTLTALNATPASMLEIFAAKGLLGVTLSIFAGILTLVLNQAFGGHLWLLVGVLAMGSIFSAAIGILLGATAKDINSLLATVKGLGLFLYAPAFVYMFPEIPQWIGQVFPTYYIIQPLLEIKQNNAGLNEISLELGILAALTLAAFAAVAWLAGRTQEAVASA